MARERALTELEGTVLGVVWARQPCTPYQVRREFLDSPSPYWSGSAGAIYPLMARLESVGLVAGAAHATGLRAARRYRVTPAGRRALKAWVSPPLDDSAIGVPPDPLRTRIAFMSVMPVAGQRALLRHAATRMREHLELAERYAAATRSDGLYFELMGRGAIAMMRTRLEWIASVERALAQSADLKPARAARRPVLGGEGATPPSASRPARRGRR